MLFRQQVCHKQGGKYDIIFSMRNSRYTIYHALAAVVVLVFAVKNNFWHTFLHGLSLGTPKPAVLLFMLFCQTALFGLLALFIWISTLFMRRENQAEAQEHPAPNRLKAVRTAAIAFLPICLVALGTELAVTTLLDKVFNVHLAPQDLIQWFQPGTYPLSIRLVLMAFVLFEAPLLEEPLFRGIMFRGFCQAMPAWAAMAASGFVFALVHVNAASFLALWYLGAAFAWLYRRTGSIVAPMTAHFLFNALNLVLCLNFPELAK